MKLDFHEKVAGAYFKIWATSPEGPDNMENISCFHPIELDRKWMVSSYKRLQNFWDTREDLKPSKRGVY